MLDQTRELLASRPRHIGDGPTGLSPQFEALRWFPLPPACVQAWPASDGPLEGHVASHCTLHNALRQQPDISIALT